MRRSAGSQTPWLESGRIDDQARAKRHSRAVTALDLDVYGTGTVGLRDALEAWSITVPKRLPD